jgi:hypothetical protein
MRYLRWNTVERRFYLIDTFSGPVLDQYSLEEIERGRLSPAVKRWLPEATSLDDARVRANYSEWPSAVVVQGAIPEVLPALNIGAVALLHIDMNCAYPERAALEFFWDHLSPGGIVLLDDYAYFGHEQQTSAIDASVRALGANVLSLPTGQGVIIK